MEIEWLSSAPASALYAALALLRGRTLVEPAIESELTPIVSRLKADLAACDCPAAAVLEQLTALASDGDASDSAWVGTALNKAVGRRHDPRCEPLLTSAAQELIAAFSRARPRAAEELPLRVDPLRSQWEARGPGLLAAMRRLSAGELLVPAASVVLVQPVLGGGGLAHPAYNRVTFEGLLANPIPQLAEVLRLGWLLGQLNFDLPALAEPLSRQRLDVVGPLALVPLVLAAAEDVELARCDGLHLRLALEAWHGSPAAADVLGNWWDTYQAARPGWNVALGALDELLKADAG
jgi:hypothetical protein